MQKVDCMARVLIVDDSISIVQSLSRILEHHGCIADVAYNGSDALRKISSANYDIAVCDIEMPGISGMNFLEKVREDFDSELDVILMTGYLEHEYFIQAIRLGASDFISKPVDSKSLIVSIDRIMQRRQRKSNIGLFFGSMNSTSVCFEIDPMRFWQAGISKAISYYLRHGLNLRRNFANDLLVCLDEMFYNALIHGTLGLNLEQRHLGQKQLQELIAEKAESVKGKSIRLCIELNTRQEQISLSVEDDGEGFDYQSWLQRLEQDQQINVDAHGRGIAMIYHLSDKLVFDKGGRKTTIIRKLPRE